MRYLSLALLSLTLLLAPATSSALNVGGQWLVNANGYTFIVSLSQSGNTINGNWKPLNNDNPTTYIKGSIKGKTIRFSRSEHQSVSVQQYQGTVFEGKSGLKMKGSFVHEGSDGYGWCATSRSSVKLDDPRQWSGCDLEACGNPQGPVGEWSTDYGLMRFPNTPQTRIRAPYPLDSSRVIGTLSGHRLSGIWAETDSAQRCETSRDGTHYWGRIRFDFNDDFTAFKGVWTYCEDKAEWNWTGRIECAEEAVAAAPAEDEEEPKEISIGKLDIDYVGWKVEHSFLQNDLRKAEQEVRDISKALEKRQQTTRRELKNLEQTEGEVKALAAKITTGYKDLDRVDNRSKNPEYRNTEQRLDKIDKRMNTILERIDYIKTKTKNSPPEATISLLDEYDDLTKERGKKEKRLKQLRRELGIEQQRKRRLEALRADEDRLWDIRRELLRAEREMSLAVSMQDFEMEQYFAANKSYDKANQAYNGLLDSGTPLITQISNDHYLARLWTPTDELNKLNQQIDTLAKLLRRLDDRRKKYREEMLDYGDEMTRKSDALISGIWKSHLSQGGVEVADFARDLYEGGSKGGFAGVAATVAKKSLELVVFGAPTYYDAEFDLSDQFAASVTSGAKMTGKRMLKTAMGHPFKASVENAVVNSEKQMLKRLQKELAQGSWFTEAMGKSDPALLGKYLDNLPGAIEAQTKSLKEAEKAFATSIGKQGAKSLGAKLAKGFAKGIAKDLAKTALKKELSEFFEGEALRDYMISQYKLSGSAILLLRASNHYWTTKDTYDALVATRNTIVEKYDPESQMFVEHSRVKKLGQEPGPYQILISDQGQNPRQASHRQMELTLNAVKAQRGSDGSLVFVIPADQVKQVGRDATLHIRVMK